MNTKKNILNALFLIVIFAITIYCIFKGQNLAELLQYIKTADIKYWVMGIPCVVAFILSESIIIHYMMNTIDQKTKLTHCFLYSFVGFFFSCITPSASGGQPAQVFYMKKDKIPISVSTLILLIITITYKLVLVLMGLAVILIRPPSVMVCLQSNIGWCYLGLFLNIICVGVMLIFVFHPTLAENIILKAIERLGKAKIIKRSDYYTEKAKSSMIQYKDASAYFKTHTFVVGNVFIITVIQRLLLFFVTYLVYLSFGLSGSDMVTIIILQGMISVAVDMLPLPGGMGISESLFLSIFSPIFKTITLPAMIISRSLSYYTELILSAVLTTTAHFTIGKNIKLGE